MKKALLTTTLTLCSVFILLGQSPAFTAEVSIDSVLMGNYIEVTFKVENVANARIVPPDFSDFKVVGGPNVSSSMQVINGDVTQSVANTFWLEPKDVGQFYIGSAQVEHEGALLETAPIEINVYHNPDGVVQTPKQKKSDDFWMEWPDRNMEPKPKVKKKRKTYRL